MQDKALLGLHFDVIAFIKNHRVYGFILQGFVFNVLLFTVICLCLSGSTDELKSPSARLTVGKLVAGGTGCFDVISRDGRY